MKFCWLRLCVLWSKMLWTHKTQLLWLTTRARNMTQTHHDSHDLNSSRLTLLMSPLRSQLISTTSSGQSCHCINTAIIVWPGKRLFLCPWKAPQGSSAERQRCWVTATRSLTWPSLCAYFNVIIERLLVLQVLYFLIINNDKLKHKTEH